MNKNVYRVPNNGSRDVPKIKTQEIFFFGVDSSAQRKAKIT